MSLPEGNPRIPEGINAHNTHPVREFLMLAVGVSVALVAIVVALSFSVKLLAPHIPFAWELAAAPRLATLSPVQEDGPPTSEAALQALGQALLESSLAVPVGNKHPAAVVPPDAVQFALLSLGHPNAFATLGAQIGVSEALLGHVQSENGLAMVLAHEIAHVQLRHPIEAAGRGIAVNIAVTALLGSGTGNLLGSSLSSGSMLTLLRFNREMELDADRRALEILRTHYGHVSGADEFFRSMALATGEQRWTEFAQTHPSTQRRLLLLEDAIKSGAGGQSLTPLAAELQR